MPDGGASPPVAAPTSWGPFVGLFVVPNPARVVYREHVRRATRAPTPLAPLALYLWPVLYIANVL